LKKRKHYKTAILRLLAAAPRPLDVERIRVGCGIGNWQTALKHCLELLYEDEIRGIKTSKSWIFWGDSSEVPLQQTKTKRRFQE
jgi:hypothetical protein